MPCTVFFVWYYNSRRLINVAFFCLFSCHEKLQSFRGGKDLFPTAKLPGFLAFIFLLQSIRVSIFYGLELVFKVSFRVRTRFRIRIDNVMSVWQLATTVAAILVLPIRHPRWLHFCSRMSYPVIYRSVVITSSGLEFGLCPHFE